ncbi:hypothetical protein RJ639_032123 [Escallonia herrerae]|uniref:Reverse transcriptase Ty1/copia-type domain-containing protein n=1 Tax=Escallonia herrerae TaxID=1293975 RepID=A0AA88X0Z6_9ASTE|nr:hypothetical protein RJ639_032123 [Escallonia herrerae]
MAIDGRGKLGHLTGDVRQPAAGDPSLSAWRSENSLIIAWLINSMEPTIAFSEIRREETRRKVMLTNLNPKPEVDVENSALVVKGNEYDNDKKKRPWCDHCKKSWHTRETCWKIHGKPLNWKKKNGSDNRAFQVSNEGNQGQQSTQEASPFTKEQQEHLYTLFQSPHFQVNPSYSLAQKGNKKIKIANGYLSAIAGTGSIGENKDEDSEFFYSQPTVSPENITMADGPNFLINMKLSGLNNENLDPKSIGLSHDIDGNKNEGSTGTKELLVYSRKQIQRNETDASQYSQDYVPQTIQNSIKATGDTHTNPIHLNLPSPESSQSESSMSNLDKPIAHRKVYVDDIILTGDDIAEMERLKQCLASEFEIKDLGSLKFFLGMEIARSRKGIAVSPRTYVLDLLKETDMSGCHPVETPIDPNQKLGDKGDPVNTSRYQKLVGKLIYLSHTRPDIAFAVSLVYKCHNALEKINQLPYPFSKLTGLVFV